MSVRLDAINQGNRELEQHLWTCGEEVLSPSFSRAHTELLHHLGQHPPFSQPENITVTFWKMPLIIQTTDVLLFAAEGWAPFGRKKSNIIAQCRGNNVVLQAAGLRSPWKPSSQGLANYKSNSIAALRTGHWSPDTSVLQSHRNTQVSIPSDIFHSAD